jgi:hypothetical protein
MKTYHLVTSIVVTHILSFYIPSLVKIESQDAIFIVISLTLIGLASAYRYLFGQIIKSLWVLIGSVILSIEVISWALEWDWMYQDILIPFTDWMPIAAMRTLYTMALFATGYGLARFLKKS